jgi:hypothetical protein
LKLLVLRVTYVVEVIHAEGFQAREHAVSGGSRFAERRMAQLPVESAWQISAEVKPAMPDCCDFTQIKLTIFICKRETLPYSEALEYTINLFIGMNKILGVGPYFRRNLDLSGRNLGRE